MKVSSVSLNKNVPLTEEQIITQLPKEEAELLAFCLKEIVRKNDGSCRINKSVSVTKLMELGIIRKVKETPNTVIGYYRVDEMKEMLKSRNISVPTTRKRSVIEPLAIENIGDLLLFKFPEKTSAILFEFNPAFEPIWDSLYLKLRKIYYDGFFFAGYGDGICKWSQDEAKCAEEVQTETQEVKGDPVEIKRLEELISKFQNSYYEGEDVNDEEFDRVWDELKRLSPNHPIFKKTQTDKEPLSEAEIEKGIIETEIEDLIEEFFGTDISETKFASLWNEFNNIDPKKEKWLDSAWKLLQEILRETETETEWKKIVLIKYEDTDKNVTERLIKIENVFEKNEKPYLYAYCYLSAGIKTFRVDRIISMKRQGAEIGDIEKYLNGFRRKS